MIKKSVVAVLGIIVAAVVSLNVITALESKKAFASTKELCNSIAIGTEMSVVENRVKELGGRHLGIGTDWQPVGFGFCHCSLHFENYMVVRKGETFCHH